jgi:multidrug efflux system membrane fusion protein
MNLSHRAHLALSLTAALAGCRDAPIDTASPTAVKVAGVALDAPLAGARYSAQILPATRVEVAFKVGGYVDAVATARGLDGARRPLQEGDQVVAGSELAALQRTDYAQRLAEARAALAQAQAGVDQATLELTRSTQLAARNAVAGAELDAARTRRDGALASLGGARARVDQAATALADTTLRAPLTGTVLKRTIEAGSLAAPGTVAFSIADVGTVKAAFGVPDTVLPRLALGAALTIASEAYPGETFPGRISLIAPSADPRSRVFEVDVTIPNADGRLKVGSVAALALAAVATPPASPTAPCAGTPDCLGYWRPK